MKKGLFGRQFEDAAHHDVEGSREVPGHIVSAVRKGGRGGDRPGMERENMQVLIKILLITNVKNFKSI